MSFHPLLFHSPSQSPCPTCTNSDIKSILVTDNMPQHCTPPLLAHLAEKPCWPCLDQALLSPSLFPLSDQNLLFFNIGHLPPIAATSKQFQWFLFCSLPFLPMDMIVDTPFYTLLHPWLICSSHPTWGLLCQPLALLTPATVSALIQQVEDL